MARQEDSMALCVRRCPLASGISRTSNESARDCCRRVVESHPNQILFHRLDEVVWHIRDEEILPDGKANFSRPVVLCHVSDTAHLLRCHPTDCNNHADIVEAGLNLSKHPNVAVLNWRFSWLALIEWKTQQREYELLFNFLDVFRDTPLIDNVFKSRPFPIRSIAVLNKHANDRGGDRNAFVPDIIHAGPACGKADLQIGRAH